MYPRRQEYDPRPPPSRLLTYQEPNQGERSRFYVAPSEAEDDSSESGYSGEGGDQTDEPVETQLGEGMEHDYDAGMLLDEDEPDFRGCHVLFIGPYPDEELLDKLKHRVQLYGGDLGHPRLPRFATHLVAYLPDHLRPMVLRISEVGNDFAPGSLESILLDIAPDVNGDQNGYPGSVVSHTWLERVSGKVLGAYAPDSFLVNRVPAPPHTPTPAPSIRDDLPPAGTPTPPPPSPKAQPLPKKGRKILPLPLDAHIRGKPVPQCHANRFAALVNHFATWNSREISDDTRTDFMDLIPREAGEPSNRNMWAMYGMDFQAVLPRLKGLKAGKRA